MHSQKAGEQKGGGNEENGKFLQNLQRGLEDAEKEVGCEIEHLNCTKRPHLLVIEKNYRMFVQV